MLAEANTLSIDLGRAKNTLRLTTQERDAAEALLAENRAVAGAEGDILSPLCVRPTPSRQPARPWDLPVSP